MKKEKFATKLDNFWYYYKFHVLAGVCVVFVLLYMYFTWVPVEKGDLNVVFVGNKIENEEKINVEKTMSEDLKSVIKTDFWLANDGLASGRHSDLQGKLMAMIEANDIDIVIMDHNSFQFYAMHGNFLKLDNDQERFPEKTEYVNAKVKDQPHEYMFGINVEGNENLHNIGFNTTDKVLAITRGTKQQKLAFQWVKWILEPH